MADAHPAPSPGYQALLRWWWVLVVMAIIGAAAGYAATTLATKYYVSNASVLVTPTGVNTQVSTGGTRTATAVNMDTEAAIMTSTSVAQLAAKELNTTLTPAELLKNLTVTVPANSEVLTVGYQDPTVAGAVRGAQAFATAYLANRLASGKATVAQQEAALSAELATQNAQLVVVSGQANTAVAGSVPQQVADAQRSVIVNSITSIQSELTSLRTSPVTPGQLISAASTPTKPSKPVKLLWAGSGAALGLLLGAGIIALLARRRARRASRAVVLPSQPAVAASPAARETHVALAAPASPAAVEASPAAEAPVVEAYAVEAHAATEPLAAATEASPAGDDVMVDPAARIAGYGRSVGAQTDETAASPAPAP